VTGVGGQDRIHLGLNASYYVNIPMYINVEAGTQRIASRRKPQKGDWEQNSTGGRGVVSKEQIRDPLFGFGQQNLERINSYCSICC
jgi:hypothetical protein